MHKILARPFSGEGSAEDRKTAKRLDALESRLKRLEQKYKRETSPAMCLRSRSLIENFFRHFSPKDPDGLEFERIGRSYDGGYVMVKHQASSKIAYSLGVENDVSWDMEMARRGYQVFQYDHSISKLPDKHSNFHFRKLGITGETQVSRPYSSLSAQVKANKHEDKQNMILKMDIEGHEWSVFNDIPEETILQFSQILVEVHGLKEIEKLVGQRPLITAAERLEKTHQVVHVHGNNNSALRILGGYPVPLTMELTLLRRDVCAFNPCTRTFPTELDQPNNPNYSEHMLGTFQF